jgi:hypothetical protein
MCSENNRLRIFAKISAILVNFRSEIFAKTKKYLLTIFAIILAKLEIFVSPFNF